MSRKIRTSEIKERIAREEWDFSKVPQKETKACCFYEYGRESTYVVVHLENPPGPHDEIDEQQEKLTNSPLVYGLPPRPIGTREFHEPWQHKTRAWREWFCRDFEAHFDSLSYARILDKTPDRAFHAKLAPHFCWRKWTKNTTRLLDRKTGLEGILVTIDWGNFDDQEIVREMKKWVFLNRPAGIGVHSNKGKRRSSWRKDLEKLTVLRLRHCYSPEEIARIIPADWTANKYVDGSEMSRACRGAREALLRLFPFLPKTTFPNSWPAFKKHDE